MPEIIPPNQINEKKPINHWSILGILFLVIVFIFSIFILYKYTYHGGFSSYPLCGGGSVSAVNINTGKTKRFPSACDVKGEYRITSNNSSEVALNPQSPEWVSWEHPNIGLKMDVLKTGVSNSQITQNGFVTNFYIAGEAYENFIGGLSVVRKTTSIQNVCYIHNEANSREYQENGWSVVKSSTSLCAHNNDYYLNLNLNMIGREAIGKHMVDSVEFLPAK